MNKKYCNLISLTNVVIIISVVCLNYLSYNYGRSILDSITNINEGFYRNKHIKGCTKPTKIDGNCSGSDDRGTPFKTANGLHYKNCKYKCTNMCPLKTAECINSSWCLSDNDCLKTGEVTYIPSRHNNEQSQNKKCNVKQGEEWCPRQKKCTKMNDLNSFAKECYDPSPQHEYNPQYHKQNLKLCPTLGIHISLDEECPFNPNILPQKPNQVVDYTDPTGADKPRPTTVPPTVKKPLCGTWKYCANENGTCHFSGKKEVIYKRKDGQQPNKFAGPKTATNKIHCSNSIFGDPIYGHQKACYYNNSGCEWKP